MFYIDYNGRNNIEIGVAVTNRPDIPVAEQRGEFIEVAGRDGSLFTSDGTFEDIIISVPMNFARAEKYWHETFRVVKNWIRGSGRLKMSDDPNWFYKVKNAAISSSKRKTKMGNEFSAVFVCDPFQYRDGGQFPVPAAEATLNPYYRAQPVYYIKGNGDFELSVNGNSVSGEIATGGAVIDTDLLVAYDSNGDPMNNQITGDYENLWLPSGSNTITITDGFELTIQPNWRTI